MESSLRNSVIETSSLGFSKEGLRSQALKGDDSIDNAEPAVTALNELMSVLEPS